ncbi:hypothetical protein [Candidatus Phycosocius bacilliformis]|uniref:hypothetical protein n=1 Tax=Candidatus Phycosocius bacilliformis TaxID=1445552 RepID=UPI001788CA5D|nr:hypothetical protein [Candidatus Phycosocius bacilliformis]
MELDEADPDRHETPEHGMARRATFVLEMPDTSPTYGSGFGVRAGLDVKFDEAPVCAQG